MGKVPLISQGEYLYNFTSRFTDGLWDPVENETSTIVYGTLDIAVVMNNDTHYLFHKCSVRPATGWCETILTAGSGPMNQLRCHCDSWLTGTQIYDPSTINRDAWGFMATAFAFVKLFEGSGWYSGQARPQIDSTFVSATA